jgi:hypothetical protein
MRRFYRLNEQEFIEKNRAAFETAAVLVHTSAQSSEDAAVSVAVRRQTAPGTTMGDVSAMALRTFGQGMKVALECATMAADAGLVRVDEDIIAIGGTGRGADTAVVVQPSYTHRFFDTRVREIICKPSL